MDARDYVVTMRRALNDCPGYTYGQQVLTGANSAGIGNGDSSIWTTRYLQEGESVPRGWSSVVDPVDPSKIIVFRITTSRASGSTTPTGCSTTSA